MNSNVDSETTVTVEGKQYRVHQTGYIEGDTNGFVEGDYEIFELDENGDWYEELPTQIGKQFMGEPDERILVYLDGEKGAEAIRNHCFGINTKPFEYLGKNWRVFKTRHPNPVYGGNNIIGTNINNAQCLVTLVTFGAVTLFEAINNETDNAEWVDCGCSDYDPY